MKMTLYISDKASIYLKQKDNMSRYVSDLIVADCEHLNAPITAEKIADVIIDRLGLKTSYSSNRCKYEDTSKNELKNNIKSILDI